MTYQKWEKWMFCKRPFYFRLCQILVPFNLRCNFKLDWNFSTFDQLPWQFGSSKFETLTPVLLREVTCFIKMFWPDSKSIKVMTLSGWTIYFVPIVKVSVIWGFCNIYQMTLVKIKVTLIARHYISGFRHSALFALASGVFAMTSITFRWFPCYYFSILDHGIIRNDFQVKRYSTVITLQWDPDN